MIKGRYAFKDKLGSGSFGSVIKAQDLITKENVAIKIFTCEDESSAVDEISLYKYLEGLERRTSQNVVTYLNSFSFRGQWHLVIEFMEFDLDYYIESNSRIRKQEICRIIRCILQGLMFLHRYGIVHGDLKPSNVGLKTYGKFECKIFDLGAAVFIEGINNSRRIIATPAYSAPELLLVGPLSNKIDIWAVGCVAGELSCRNKCFADPCNLQRMRKYVEYFGFPPEYLLGLCTNTSYFFEINDNHVTMKEIEGQGPCFPNSRKIEDLVGVYNDELFINFIQKCFRINPVLRSSASELLKDHWLENNLCQLMQPSSETLRQGLLFSVIIITAIFLILSDRFIV